jgi:hypothetical protein
VGLVVVPPVAVVLPGQNAETGNNIAKAIIIIRA